MFCSNECRSLWESKNLKGKNSVGWKGGLTSKYKKLRTGRKWRNWRLKVFERDKFLCQMPNCDRMEKFLHPHHIKKFYKYKKSRFDIKNGITLCKKCHKKIQNKEEKYEELFIKLLT